MLLGWRIRAINEARVCSITVAAVIAAQSSGWPQTARSRVFKSKWLVSVAQKAQIRSTSEVILPDTETTIGGPMSRAYRTAGTHDDPVIAFLLFCLEIYQAEKERKRKLH